jgi:glutathione S-transferase
MRADREITLFHSPQTRSTGALILLEELHADYRLQLLDLRGRQEHLQPAFLAINPMGQVPTIRHGDAVVTEQIAIVLYLADLYPEAGLAPPIGDPLRGPYLRWMAFYGSCFEPAVFEPAMVDRALKREAAPVATSPYGDFDAVLATLLDQLAQGPYFLGERFTALDLLCRARGSPGSCSSASSRRPRCCATTSPASRRVPPSCARSRRIPNLPPPCSPLRRPPRAERGSHHVHGFFRPAHRPVPRSVGCAQGASAMTTASGLFRSNDSRSNAFKSN